ncbi:hypothetical protein [Streptomyces sp. NPDC005209]|uniref:hypothetical protein n=1 Tax=Streptomyces sp. NPDC005209 TaxID=3156715 RepID=UPI0033B24450
MSLPLLFGADIGPAWNAPAAPARPAQHIEDAGLYLITIQDHPPPEGVLRHLGTHRTER